MGKGVMKRRGLTLVLILLGVACGGTASMGLGADWDAEYRGAVGEKDTDTKLRALARIAESREAPARVRASALMYSGDLLVRIDRARALEFYGRAETVVADIEDAGLCIGNLLRLSSSYRAGQDWDRAVAVAETAERMSTGAGLTANCVDALLAEAEAHACASRPEETAKYLGRAREMMAGVPEEGCQYRWRGQMAGVLGRLGKKHDAAQCAVEQAAYARNEQQQWGAYSAAISYLQDAGQVVEACDLFVAQAPLCVSQAGCGELRRNVLLGSKEDCWDAAVKALGMSCCLLGPGARFAGPASDASRARVDLLLKQGRAEEALLEARRCYMLCDIRRLDTAIEAVVGALSAVDGRGSARAKRFLDFQTFGPQGPDGVPGTADDLTDPMGVVAIPATKDYELLGRLCASADVTDCRLRGYSHLVKGETALALSEMRAAYAVASCRALSAAAYDVATAIKAADGHPLLANAYLLYQKFGPAAADGIRGTADDLVDPLQGMDLRLSEARHRALQDAIDRCGSDYGAVRRKAYLLLADGRCKEGIETMQQAYALCPMRAPDLCAAVWDVAAAIKAVDGHIWRANEYVAYQRFGPFGPDGRPGTNDDMKDPLTN